MKWIVVLLIAAACIWAYYNVNIDATSAKNSTTDTIKQEKTLKKFFNADEQNKQETREVLENF